MLRKTPITPYQNKIKHPVNRRKNLNPIMAVMILVAIWYLLIGKGLLSRIGMPSDANEAGVRRVYDEFTCSEANLARLIGVTLGQDSEEGEEEESLWYEKYYKQLEGLGVDLKSENAFNVLSSSKLEKILNQLASHSIKVEAQEKLPLYKVLEYYDQILKEKNQTLMYETLTILATPATKQDLGAWEVATSKGKFKFEGLVLDPLKDQTIQVAYWDDELLGVISIENEKSKLTDCKIVEVNDQGATFEIAGMTFQYQNDLLKEEDVGKTGTLTVSKGKIEAFEANGGQEVDTLVSISGDEIVLEKAGKLIYNGISIDDQTGKNQYKTIGDLTYGLKVAYTKQGGEITRLQIVGDSAQNEIRVLLSNQKGDYFQEKVSCQLSGDYDLVYNGKASTLVDGSTWDSDSFKWEEKSSMVRLIPRAANNRIGLMSLGREEKGYGYPGILEICKKEKGYLLINEMNLEDYVVNVLPSEMPSNYGTEALKAQAVAVRTYGEASMKQGKFMAYGAHVDDTTASQVYHHIRPDEAVRKAVKATEGQVLKADGVLISNKFFAASCGYTANFGEVWAGSSFPSQSPSYLVSRQQYLGDQMVPNLQSEENFKSFIELSAEDLDAFDEDSPWFRWQAKLSRKEVENLMIPALKTLSVLYPKQIVYQSKAGIVQDKSIADIGSIYQLEVEKRGQGGNMMTLKIVGEKADIMVSTEYLIRSLFASNKAQNLEIERSNGTKVDELTLLPSAFFTIEEEDDENHHMKAVTLIGGGNGHGVGLSQDGAKGMAKRGYSYDQILKHYYKDCEITEG